MGQQERSGESITEFCRQHGLKPRSFYRWRRVFAAEQQVSFVPLTIAGTRRVDIELPCGATVKVAANRESLQEVFAALLNVEVDNA
jgi:transposase-like protein